MKAHYHHKSGWVKGDLMLHDGRITFRADNSTHLRQGYRIRAPGMVEEPLHGFKNAPPHLAFAYRPPGKMQLVFLRIGRRGHTYDAAFAVESADSVIKAVEGMVES